MNGFSLHTPLEYITFKPLCRQAYSFLKNSSFSYIAFLVIFMKFFFSITYFLFQKEPFKIKSTILPVFAFKKDLNLYSIFNKSFRNRSFYLKSVRKKGLELVENGRDWCKKDLTGSKFRCY